MIVAVALAAALAATPPAGSGRAKSCILVSSSSNTQYYPSDDHTIAIHSDGRWYKLTVSPSSLLNEPQTYFINDIRGPSTLCSPLDFDLKVVETGGGIREGLIAQSFQEIPASEGEALRKLSRR